MSTNFVNVAILFIRTYFALGDQIQYRSLHWVLKNQEQSFIIVHIRTIQSGTKEGLRKMQDQTLDQLDQQVEEYCAAWHNITALYEDYAKILNLSYSSLQVLNVIFCAREACTQKTICRQTFLPKQTVNAIITGYWKQGVVELTEMKSDRRSKAITLTASGKAYAEEILPQIHAAEVKAMAKLGETQRAALLTTTKLYLEHFRECIQSAGKVN